MQTRGNPRRIGEILRRTGGAVEVNFRDDIKPEEMGAIIYAITNTGRDMGWTPAQLFGKYWELENARLASEQGNNVVRAPFGGRPQG
jgi:hypothetical protein